MGVSRLFACENKLHLNLGGMCRPLRRHFVTQRDSSSDVTSLHGLARAAAAAAAAPMKLHLVLVKTDRNYKFEVLMF